MGSNYSISIDSNPNQQRLFNIINNPKIDYDQLRDYLDSLECDEYIFNFRVIKKDTNKEITFFKYVHIAFNEAVEKQILDIITSSKHINLRNSIGLFKDIVL